MPVLGVASTLALLGGLVYFGTRHEETHNTALEDRRKERFEKIFAAGSWEKPPELAESVTDSERRGIAEAGKTERKKLEKLEKMKEDIDKQIEKKKMDIVFAFDDKVKQVQIKHDKKSGQKIQ